jgi:formamidopyrimidine-DNA glycosylase
MTDSIPYLIDLFSRHKEFIVGRFIDTDGNYIEDRFELFIADTTMDSHKTAEDIRKATKQKVLQNESLRNTLVIGEWNEHDCHGCGGHMNSIDKDGKTVYFCAQCVKFG